MLKCFPYSIASPRMRIQAYGPSQANGLSLPQHPLLKEPRRGSAVQRVVSPTSSPHSKARGVKTMVPLSLNVAQLEVLFVIASLLFFAFLFLAIFFSAIIGGVMARMLYVGGRWCVKKIQQSQSARSTRTVNVVGRLVPHHRTYGRKMIQILTITGLSPRI